MNIKTVYKNLKRHKAISIINISGLVIGIMSVLFILEYVYYERSYDSYQKNADHIYRVGYKRFNNGQLQWETANSYYPIGNWLKENYSEVVDCANLRRFYNISVSYKDAVGNIKSYFEPKNYFATSSIFSFFDIKLIQGSENCLKEPNTVAISEQIAHKYFGKTDPIGKMLKINDRQQYTVTAVYQRLPKNSHLQTDFLFSLLTVFKSRPGLVNNWGGDDLFHTYIQFKEEANIEAFREKAFIKMIESNYKSQLESRNQQDEFFMQALSDIHLKSNIDFETEPPGSEVNISILHGFAILLLIIAWINYINLVTAQSVERAKEIGVKKTSGATRLLIAKQFITEAFLFNLLCLVMALAAFFVLNSGFKSVANIDPDFNLFHVPEFLVLISIAFPVGVLASSIYPAFVLSSMNPVKVLKGKFKNSAHGFLLRKGLVTIQFMISVGLMTGTIVTYNQSSYLLNKDAGLNYKSSFVVRAPITSDGNEARINKFNLIQNKIKALPEISSYTLMSDAPGDQVRHFKACGRQGFPQSDIKWYDQIIVDDQFIDFYDMKILAGRKFHENESSEQHTVILNEIGAFRLGYANPKEAINKIIVNQRNEEFKVVGVVEDFHYLSVKSETKPFVLTIDNRNKNFIALKFHEKAYENLDEAIAKVENIFTEIYPGQPFEYFSMDEKMRMHLKQDRTFSGVFGVFSALAIVIAVIGIMGLILININQNMKELGVRKVLGAELKDVLILLSKQLIVQFAIALIIALPLSYYCYEYEFLSTYIHRIDLNVWIFAIPVLLLSLIIFSVVLFIGISAYRVNVSKVIQYE